MTPVFHRFAVWACVAGACGCALAAESARRRVSVSTFRATTGDSVWWYGRAESSAAWLAACAGKVEETLVQSQKMDVLAGGTNADWIVTADVRFRPVVAPGVNPLTGQAYPATSQIFAEASCTVYGAVTRRIVRSETVKVDALQCPAADVATFVSLSAEMAAKRIAEIVLGAADPSFKPQTADAPAVLPPPMTTTVRGNGSTGVVTPF